jgi:hypothetical protein
VVNPWNAALQCLFLGGFLGFAGFPGFEGLGAGPGLPPPPPGTVAVTVFFETSITKPSARFDAGDVLGRKQLGQIKSVGRRTVRRRKGLEGIVRELDGGGLNRKVGELAECGSAACRCRTDAMDS